MLYAIQRIGINETNFFFHKCAENRLFYWNIEFFGQKMPFLTVFLLQITQNQFSIFFKNVTFFKSLFFPSKKHTKKKKFIGQYNDQISYSITILIKNIVFISSTVAKFDMRSNFQMQLSIAAHQVSGVEIGHGWENVTKVGFSQQTSKNIEKFQLNCILLPF